MARQAGKPKVPFASLFPSASPEALDLLERMLAFNPARRITVDEALAHPYLAALHSDDPEDEPVCPSSFDFSFERQVLDKPALQRLMLEQIAAYHPEVGAWLPRGASGDGTRSGAAPPLAPLLAPSALAASLAGTSASGSSSYGMPGAAAPPAHGYGGSGPAPPPAAPLAPPVYAAGGGGVSYPAGMDTGSSDGGGSSYGGAPFVTARSFEAPAQGYAWPGSGAEGSGGGGVAVAAPQAAGLPSGWPAGAALPKQ